MVAVSQAATTILEVKLRRSDDPVSPCSGAVKLRPLAGKVFQPQADVVVRRIFDADMNCFRLACSRHRTGISIAQPAGQVHRYFVGDFFPP